MPVISVSWEVEIWRTKVQGQLRQKVNETPMSANILGVMVLAYDPSYMRGIGLRPDCVKPGNPM
jgi:hypothetical protein